MDIGRQLVSAYRYVGPRNGDIPAAFRHHVHPLLYHATLSPCFLEPGVALAAADLRALAGTLLRQYRGPLRLSPFFTVLDLPGSGNVEGVRRTAKVAGWSEGHRDHIECWDVRTPAGPVGNYLFDMGSSKTDPSLNARAMQLAEGSLALPPALAKVLAGLAATYDGPVFTVVAKTPDGTDVAAGTVFCRERTGFLVGGVVTEAHRGKGLWRQLVRHRQEMSKEVGVDVWMYTTNNPRLIGKAPQQFAMQSFFKGA